MDRIVDLDQAAAEIESRRAAWVAAGLTVGPVTWRDEAAPRPKPLETERGGWADELDEFNSVTQSAPEQFGPGGCAGRILMFTMTPFRTRNGFRSRT